MVAVSEVLGDDGKLIEWDASFVLDIWMSSHKALGHIPEISPDL